MIPGGIIPSVIIGSGGPPFIGLDHDGGDFSTSTDLIAGLSNKTTGSIGFWAEVPADNNQRTVFCVGVTSGTRTTLVVQFIDKKIFIDCILDLNVSISWRWQATDAMVSGDWHHFVLAHNGTVPVVYADGSALAGSFAVETNKTLWFKALINDATNKSDIVLIGASQLGGAVTEFYDSEVTQLGLSSSVFSAADAARIMRDANAVADYDLAYYRINAGGDSQLVHDSSGNGYHMKLGSTSGTDANDPAKILHRRLTSQGPV